MLHVLHESIKEYFPSIKCTRWKSLSPPSLLLSWNIQSCSLVSLSPRIYSLLSVKYLLNAAEPVEGFVSLLTIYHTHLLSHRVPLLFCLDMYFKKCPYFCSLKSLSTSYNSGIYINSFKFGLPFFSLSCNCICYTASSGNGSLCRKCIICRCLWKGMAIFYLCYEYGSLHERYFFSTANWKCPSLFSPPPPLFPVLTYILTWGSVKAGCRCTDFLFCVRG